MREIKLKKPHFGLHVTLDCYGCSSGLLESRSAVRRFLNRSVALLRMRKLNEPMVARAPGNGKKDPGGWSGAVMIQESHVTAHTFPKRRFVSIDVYSCRDFSHERITSFVRKFFHVSAIEKNVIVRGKRYPQRNVF